MPNIRNVDNIELVPVLTLEPSTFSKPERRMPDDPAAWQQHWLDSLADSGIEGLKPIRESFTHVATTEFSEPKVLQRVLFKLFDRWGGLENLLDPECNPVLSGGLALCSAGELLMEPQCCSDLANLSEWQDAVQYQGDQWKMLWIGHPWLMIRFWKGRYELESHEEGKVTPVDLWSVGADDLRKAVIDARAEQQRFACAMAPLLPLYGLTGPPKALSEQLAGLGSQL
ncbi:MAG TPA: hypothetical protein VFE47_05200 [Tepidisphaeraceae bacterium]|jgi:hypothetical protein|nr:hypothetical protein [Tepidisphaeraceae bacterium]